MSQLIEESVPLEKLLLDPNNFRFQDDPGFLFAREDRFAEGKVQERALLRLRQTGLAELKSSILTNGFLPFEKIVVQPFSSDGDKYVVVEGNRRVAALNWIHADHEAGVEVPSEVLETLENVPVSIVPAGADESLILSLMGVRHVGGIRQWGGYQSAKLVATLRDNHDFEPSDVASRLGMTAHEVNRRYRAFKALEQMMNDEEYSDQARPDMYPLFHEAVARTVIKSWLEWDEESHEFTNVDTLVQFYGLLTPHHGPDGEEIPPKLTSRENVSALRFILIESEAKRSLLDSSQQFEEALGLAKAKELSRTWVAQVSEALTAVKSVGALELEQLEQEDLKLLGDIEVASRRLLTLHEKLTSD